MILNNIIIIAALASLVMIVIGKNWRYRVGGLAILYLINFVLILQVWPIALASVKLIGGWMGVVLLSASQIQRAATSRVNRYISQTIFQLLMIILVWIVLMAITPSINEWIPIPYTHLYVGLTMVTAGLIFASISHSLFEIIIGVLTFLAGFDVIYSSVEGSALVTGIYALLTILICVLNTYFTTSANEVER